MIATRKVLVLWDPVAQQPRGKTQSLDCNWARAVESKLQAGVRHQGYREVPVGHVPAGTGRCSYCGGGR